METYKLTEEQIAICEDRECPVEAIEAFMDSYDIRPDENNMNELIEDLCDRYYGEFYSEEAFAQSRVQDFIFSFIKDAGARDIVEMYFDYGAYARDIFVNDFDFYRGGDGRGYIFSQY